LVPRQDENRNRFDRPAAAGLNGAAKRAGPEGVRRAAPNNPAAPANFRVDSLKPVLQSKFKERA